MTGNCPRTNGSNRIERQGLIIHDNALHRLADDGENLAIHHHLSKRPDAASMQESHTQKHIRHDNACHERGQAVLNAGLPVWFFCTGGKRTHRERDIIEIGKHIGGCSVEEILRTTAGIGTCPQIGGGLSRGIKDRRTRVSQLDKAVPAITSAFPTARLPASVAGPVVRLAAMVMNPVGRPYSAATSAASRLPPSCPSGGAEHCIK